MSKSQREFFEEQLLSISKGVDYPRTPDVAGAVMRRLRKFPSPLGRGVRGEGLPRRLAWSLTIILILCSSLMLIPPARAAILEFIQVGVVRIFRPEATPLPPNEELPATMSPVTATPASTSEPLIPLLRSMAGAMTLEEAAQTVDYPILLPSYPPELGQPDYVFVQYVESAMTILVWTDPQQPDQVLLSLHFVPKGSWAIEKSRPLVIQETTVNEQRAIWAVGPYPVRFSNGNLDFVRLIEGQVLIWEKGDVTYRLETDQSLEEAIRIAESLRPIP